MDQAWERLSSGLHAALIGEHAPTPPSGFPRAVLRIACQGHDRPRGPLLEAQARMGRLAEGAGLLDAATLRLRQGLRRKILGEWSADPDEGLVEALNRAEALVDPPRVLVLEGVERADEATVRFLRRAIASPTWLRVPVLLVFRHVPLEGPAAALAADFGLEPGAPPPSQAIETSHDLSPRAALVLRAAATIGAPFTPEQVAALVGTSPLAVLVELQEAMDAGVPLTESSPGHLSMPDDLARALRRGVLPSLRAAWEEALSTAQPQRAPAPQPARAEASAPPLAAAPEPEAPPDEADLVAIRLLQEARQAFMEGRDRAASSLAARAISTLDALPPSRARRLLRVEILADLGQYRRESPGSNGGTRLADALRLVDEARGLLEPGDPVELAAGVHALLGSLCYDLGDPSSLEKGLDAFSTAIRLLDAAGQPIAAARLLNDQAAVWVRLGDPVRATHLLRTSREVFEQRAESDDDARIELAETDHLLARLPFHVAAKAGQQAVAYAAAIEHAERAGAIYEGLDRVPELARVWETLGRLELKRGNLDQAAERLLEAVAVQQRIGDLLGLARSTAALSEGLALADRMPEAMSLLADSIELNLRHGTPLGLAHNRRALDAMDTRLGDDARYATAIARIRGLLERAESIAGRAELPPDFV